MYARTSIANFGSLETAIFHLIMSTNEDPLDDSMLDFLDELGAPETPRKETTDAATTELFDALLEDTPTNTDSLDTPQKERRDSITKEIPKAAMAKEISRSTSPKVNMNRKTTVSSSNKNKSKPLVRAKPKQQVAPDYNPPPKSNGSKSYVTPTRGGLTMYERSMLQMEEREQKLKALQDKLSADCTFTPKSNGSSHGKASTPHTGGTSDGGVGNRLYHSETKASQKKAHPKGVIGGGATPRSQPPPQSRANKSRSRSRSNSLNSANTKSSSGTLRLDEMHQQGQQSLRSRTKTDKEEEQARRRRMEEELLAVCTFQPKTKWNLAKERRKKAQEGAGRAIPSPGDEKRGKLSVRLLESL